MQKKLAASSKREGELRKELETEQDEVLKLNETVHVKELTILEKEGAEKEMRKRMLRAVNQHTTAVDTAKDTELAKMKRAMASLVTRWVRYFAKRQRIIPCFSRTPRQILRAVLTAAPST